MMNEVYNEESFSKDGKNVKDEFKEIIKEDLIFGGKTYNEKDNKGLRIETRDFKYSTINVIPALVTYENDKIYSGDLIKKIYSENNYDNELTIKGIQLISDYLIKVPLYYYQKNKTEEIDIGKFKIHVINDDYSFERGLFHDDETCF